MTEPWERQPGESAPAFEAFACYRDMGSTRSTANVGQEFGKSKRLMDRWCARWAWVARAEAWDADLDRREREAAIAAEQSEIAKWVQVRAEHRNRMLMSGQQLLARADEMLKWPIATRTITQGENGEQIVTLTPARWSFGDVGRLVEVADKLIRLAAEMHTDSTRITLEEVRRVAEQIGASEEDLARLTDALGRGEDIAVLAERIANGHDRHPRYGHLPGAWAGDDLK